MKKFFILLILILSLQTLSKADNISEFEVEGISIGDSLLDYMSINEIKRWYEITNNDYKYLKEPLKFREVYLKDPNFKTYTTLSFFIKSNDKNYKIFSIRGMKDYINDLNSCLKVRNEISNDIEKIANQYKKNEHTIKSKLDISGKSFTKNIAYDFNSGGGIEILCNDWEESFRKQNNFTEGLSVMVQSAEVLNWITNY